MHTQRYIIFLLALSALFPGCFNPGIAQLKRQEKAMKKQMAQEKMIGGVPQERKMADRFYRSDPNERQVHSMYDGKPYADVGNYGLRPYRQAEAVHDTKSAPIKSFSSKTFIDTGAYGSKDKQFSTDVSHLADKSENPGSSSYNSKKYDGDRAYADGHDGGAISDRTFATRATSVPGAASKEQLNEQAKALQNKIDAGTLTIDQVRELLNKK